MKNLLGLTVIACALVVSAATHVPAFVAQTAIGADEQKPVEPIQSVEQILANVPDERIRRILTDLVRCESSGRINVKVLDTNKEYSYGILQFQVGTFNSFGKKYKILSDSLEMSETENLIYDPNLQIKIASKMIDEGLWYHWKNCYEKVQ